MNVLLNTFCLLQFLNSLFYFHSGVNLMMTLYLDVQKKKQLSITMEAMMMTYLCDTVPMHTCWFISGSQN